MKILHLTDIHGNSNQFESIAKWLEAANLVILSGDITNFGRKSATEDVLLEIEKQHNHRISIYPHLPSTTLQNQKRQSNPGHACRQQDYSYIY
jgi:Icc-related predicted phosphoesterase